MASTVSEHPQKQRVIDGILAGESVRDIAKSVSPPLSRAAVHRFRQQIIAPALAQSFQKINELKEMREATLAPSEINETNVLPYRHKPDHETARETERSALLQPFISRIAKKYDRYDKLLSKAVQGQTVMDKHGNVVELDPDIKAIAALDAAETRSMDFHARLVGAIAPTQQEAQQSISLTIVLPRPGEQLHAASNECIDITAEPAE